MQAPNQTVYSVAQAADFMTTQYWGGVSYTFDLGPERALTVDLTGLPQEARTIANWAMEAWTTLTGISFVDVARDAQITFDDAAPGAFARSSMLGGDIVRADINVSPAWLASQGTTFGSYSTMTYIHEIGHALGLGHPGDYNGSARYGVDNNFANDSWQMSVMSYFSQRENTSIEASYAHVMTPMLADIMAIRMLYGSVPLRTGDTIYGDGSTAGGTYDHMSALRAAGQLGDEVAWAIVDDGGYDVLDIRSSSADQSVDLRPEEISSVYGLIGNLAIDATTTIEEVRTGSGNDLIQARDIALVALTGEGHDTVHGGAGDDRIEGQGSGQNVFLGNGGDDIIRAGSGDDMLAGGSGNDDLRGGAGKNVIYLGLGDDFTGGGAGNDQIFGGAGTNEIYGGLGSDTVQGGAGDDLIVGGGNGNNALLGHNGNDTLYAGTGGDLMGGGAGNDRLFGSNSNDLIYLGLGNDFAGGGAGNDVLHAGLGWNEIYGGLGDDTIHAGTGRDVMIGSPGADVFVFASAATAGIGATRDVIADFEAGLDKIDLSAMAADLVSDPEVAGAAGPLRYIPGFVTGDLNGDGVTDFAIQIIGAQTLSVDDILL